MSELFNNMTDFARISRSEPTQNRRNRISFYKIDTQLLQTLLNGDYNKINSDGVISNFRQGRIGDCYLLAGLSALASTEDGAKILKDNMKRNKNGSYTITFPGAAMVNEDYKKEGKISYIKNSYTITPQEVARAKKSGKYAKGDDDVIMYELAFEKYRKDVMRTNRANKLNPQKFESGQYIGGGTTASPLNGGYSADAMFILTGRKSTAFYGNYQTCELISVNTIKGINPIKQRIPSRLVEKYLNKIMNNPERYAVVTSFQLERNGRRTGGHALQITRVTEDRVYLSNPWNSGKEICLTREEFMSSVTGLEIWDSKDSGFSTNKIENLILSLIKN